MIYCSFLSYSHTPHNASYHDSPVLLRLLDPKDGGSRLITNVGNYLPTDKASHPSRLGSLTTPL
jgi:hypothetical protein